MPPNAAEAVAIIGNHVCFDNSVDGAADWERLPDLPTSTELMDSQATSDDLPWFPIKHKWQNKADYLEALYKILRFEGIEGLRYSIKTVRGCPNMVDEDNTCIYTKVRVQGYLFAKMGPLARISFSTQRAGVRIKWKQSKRLQAGKIVALSTDFFKSDCRVAVVAQRPIEGGLDQKPPVIDILWANTNEAVIDPDQDLVMVESRSGYYEAVRHALKGLQHAARESSPIDKYTVSLNDEDLPYSSVPTMLDFSSLVDHLTADQMQQAGKNKHIEQQMFCEIEDRFRGCNSGRKLQGIQPYTSLDDSQLEALQRMVSKELAIVQGPPGTGKTFTSIKSIKVILQNRQPGDPPIIVSAQTNHALDQLLIYCLSARASIMRVGGRTENDEIAARTIYELRISAGRPSYGQYAVLEKARRKIIDRFEGLVSGVLGRSGLLDPQTLLDAGVITQAQHKSLTDDGWESINEAPAMETWLGDEKIERLRQRLDDDAFEEIEAADETEEIELDTNFNDDQGDEDDDRIYGTFVALSSQLTGQTPQAAGWERRCRKMLEKDNLYDTPIGIRGGVYQMLQSRLREATSHQFLEVLKEATQQAKMQKINCWTRDLHVIDKHRIDIIGCTTTGLTKYRGFLAAIKPRILLIEEAAETREANIASALYPSVHQLILVGDHQQLPPSCDIARLAKDPYNLNVSLFERLVENRLPYTMLDHQRRMVPELRRIVQKFYPNLRDHPLVTDMAKRPLVPGMGDRRSWFFTHAWPEDTDADNSKYNQQEAEMVVGFIRYLLHNNVKASEITVLTYYKGQKRKILQRLRRKDIPLGNFFNVATVDSYQGEENDIIILSLVRSPKEGHNPNVGFLDSRNRATVAISRARRGFFMFGNKQNLLFANNDTLKTWGPIWNAFAEQGRVAMSKGLPLICQNHGNETWIKDSDGLVGNAGGCWTKCTGKLTCGHDCALVCHNISHEKLPCLHPCVAVLPCGHKCAGCCSDPCRCAVNCADFMKIQLNKQMAQLQLSGNRLCSPRKNLSTPTSSPGSAFKSCRRSPVAWQDLAQNPKAHDDAMRDVLLLDLKENSLQDAGDETVTTTLKQALESIQETFIPVSNVDGRRIQGGKHTMDVRQEPERKQQQHLRSVGGPPSLTKGEQSGPDGSRGNHGGCMRGNGSPQQQAVTRASQRAQRFTHRPQMGHHAVKSGAQSHALEPSLDSIAQSAAEAESLIDFDKDPVDSTESAQSDSQIGSGMSLGKVSPDAERIKEEEPESLLIDLA